MKDYLVCQFCDQKVNGSLRHLHRHLDDCEVRKRVQSTENRYQFWSNYAAESRQRNGVKTLMEGRP